MIFEKKFLLSLFFFLRFFKNSPPLLLSRVIFKILFIRGLKGITFADDLE